MNSTASLASEENGHPDRLVLMLFIAAALHAIIILGVSFSPVLQEMRTPPALEVVLVEPTESETPDEADYLAQTAQDGGGENDDNARPSRPFVSEQDFDTDGIAPTRMQAQAPNSQTQQSEEILTTVFADREVDSRIEDDETAPELPQKDAPLVEQNLEIARLSAEVNLRLEEYAKRPKKTWLTARTHASSAASYMYGWVEQVERVGNLNYPDDARRDQLSGSLVLVVGILKDGSIESLTIKKSSGHAVLDDAAQRIVRLAAPFPPLTGELADQTDILYIVRTWEFNTTNTISSY